MTIIDEVIEESIKGRLDEISIVNGYLNDASVLDGYMVHYVGDLYKGKNNLTFPCIAFQPTKDEPPVPSGDSKKLKITREMRVIGAVDVQSRASVNSSLNSLVKDVRKALLFDKYSNGVKANEIVLGETHYDLADSKDSYAFFELQFSITYVEDV